MLSPEEVFVAEVFEQNTPIIQPGYGALLDAIAAVDAACFSTPWERREIRAFLSFAENQVVDVPIAHYCLVAMLGGKVAGFALATFRREESQVHRLAVLPSHRRRGVGSYLLKALELKALRRKSPGLSIMLRESNVAAQVWFREHGYRAPRTDALHPDAFPDGESALVMMRMFASAFAPVKVRIVE